MAEILASPGKKAAWSTGRVGSWSLPELSKHPAPILSFVYWMGLLLLISCPALKPGDGDPRPCRSHPCHRRRVLRRCGSARWSDRSLARTVRVRNGQMKGKVLTVPTADCWRNIAISQATGAGVGLLAILPVLASYLRATADSPLLCRPPVKLDYFQVADHPGVDAIFANTSAFIITETPGRRRGGFS